MVRASQYSVVKVGKRCVAPAQSLRRTSYPPAGVLLWRRDRVLSTTIMRMSNVSLACVRRDLTMVASVNDAELAARKTDEVWNTVLRGTTFFSLF